MGLKNLPVIVGELLAHGRSPETPVALIRWGTTEKQETVTGTLANIVDKAAALRPPVVVVIGEVVSFARELCWFDPHGPFPEPEYVVHGKGLEYQPSGA